MGIKSRLREYLEKTGFKITADDMMLCPFHNEKTPSMKVYGDHAYCFGCNERADIYDFAALRLAFPCDKAHFPRIAREVEAVLGIAGEWRPSADERRAYYRRNRDAGGKQAAALSGTAAYRDGLLREMAEAVDYGNLERARLAAELLFALFLLPDSAGAGGSA